MRTTVRVENPMMGGLRVVRVAIADIERMPATAGVQGMLSGGSVEPMAQILAMQEMLTFEDLRYLDAEDVPAGSFSYTPHDGASVTEPFAGAEN